MSSNTRRMSERLINKKNKECNNNNNNNNEVITETVTTVIKLKNKLTIPRENNRPLNVNFTIPYKYLGQTQIVDMTKMVPGKSYYLKPEEKL
jgi:hypothetical protein